MTDIFQAYEDRLDRRNRKKSTLDNFHAAVRDYTTWLEAEGVDPLTVTEETIEKWSRSNHYAPTTRFSYYNIIASVYKYAHLKGTISRYPFVDTLPPSVPEKRPQILSNAKLREIGLRAQGDRQKTMFHLFAYTGMRLTEGRLLHHDNVEETEYGWQITVLPETCKTGKIRYIPVHEKLLPFLRGGTGWVFPGPNGPISEPVLYKELWTIWPDHPKGKSFHIFRSTMASSMDHNGVSEAIVERILGWSRRSMFDKHYRHIADERLHEAISRLYVNDPLTLGPTNTSSVTDEIPRNEQ